jgi:hypothetical protein
VKAFERRNLLRGAVLLLALLPTQLAIETGVAFFLPRQESAVLKIQGNQVQVDHVEYMLAPVPLSDFTWQLLRVTQIAFVGGLVLLVALGVREPLPVRSLAMRTVRWILLPVAVLVSAIAVAFVFFQIHKEIEDACASRYGLDISLCPAPWFDFVSPGLMAVGGAAAAAFAVLSGYAAAPTARLQTARITAVLVMGFALWLFFVRWWWQMLFVPVAVLGVTILISRREMWLADRR